MSMVLKIKSEVSKTVLVSRSSLRRKKTVKEKTNNCVKSEPVLEKCRGRKKVNLEIEYEAEEHSADRKRKVPACSTKKTKESFCRWKDEDYLANMEKIPVPIARNIIDLLNDENTIPFIARYRSHLTGELKPEKLRKIRDTYEYILRVHQKAGQLVKLLSAANELTPSLLSFIENARTLEELESVEPKVKKEKRKTLEERARELGLQSAAECLLEGRGVVSLEALVNANVSDLNNVKKVRLGIQHIIAAIIRKTFEVHSRMENIITSKKIMLRSELKNKYEKNEMSKYEVYKDFRQPLHTIKPHQTLAINRGESEGKLSVMIEIPDSLWLPLKSFCKSHWLSSGMSYDLRSRLFNDSVDDAVMRLLKPFAVRLIRARLKSEAENEAVSVFGHNLRQLLLTAPFTGRTVMGVDPGFAKGCKVAVVSHMGDVLGSDRFFLRNPSAAKQKLKSLISEFRCETIALGNGCGSRETEVLLSKFINEGCFKPLNVCYTIISEQAVSIYSCSPVAAEEFPHLEPTVVGAVSLARRLQSPLSELVKVEPKHLGVGMYQHDINEKKLQNALDEVVSECVSFVGVDVNSASIHLLKRVAGLNTSKAQEIIKYRTDVCPFKRREDLKKVKGIKEKTFRQCAGFLRIVPSTARCLRHEACSNEKSFNPLDETSIHPESYETVYKIIDYLGLSLHQLGSESFIGKINNSGVTVEKLAKFCECAHFSLSFIVDVLTKPRNFDLRSLSPGPIFCTKIKTLEELKPGLRLKGIVRNVVNFGAFVDLGVGLDGLIHISQAGDVLLEVNNRVNVEITYVNEKTQRIQLKLISLI